MIGVVAIYPEDRLAISGDSRSFTRPTAMGSTITFHFCPTCGSSLFWRPASRPGMVGVAVGGFADPSLRAPKDAIWKDLRPSWLCLASEVQDL